MRLWDEMWARCFSGCFVVLLAVVSLRAGPLATVRRAQGLLGPAGWSQILRIDKLRPGHANASVVYALAFELEDRLWYYEGESGTQSLSLLRGHLAEDKADLLPLLREVDPGFVHYQVMENGANRPAPGKNRGDLPQGCFIECVAQLQAMIDAGDPPDVAQLMAYYASDAADTPGHTELFFSRDGRRYCYDPLVHAKPKLIPPYVASDALAIARWSAPGQDHVPPKRAVFLPLHLPNATNPELAARRLVAVSAKPREGAGNSILTQ